MARSEVPFPSPAQVGAEDLISTFGHVGQDTVVRGQSGAMMLVFFTCQQGRPLI